MVLRCFDLFGFVRDYLIVEMIGTDLVFLGIATSDLVVLFNLV